VLIDIELCHVYLRNFRETGALTDRDVESICRGKRHADAAIRRSNRVRFSVMLDDGAGGPTRGETKEIKRQIELHGVKLDQIVWESDLTQFAPSLIASLRSNYHSTLGDSDFLSIVTGDRYMWAEEEQPHARSIRDLFYDKLKGKKIDDHFLYNQCSKFRVPLRVPDLNGGRIYSCPLLTAVWYLSRLGVSGFVHTPGRPKADAIVNVLAIEYLKNEAMAYEIIRLSSATRIKKCAKKIEYIFI